MWSGSSSLRILLKWTTIFSPCPQSETDCCFYTSLQIAPRPHCMLMRLSAGVWSAKFIMWFELCFEAHSHLSQQHEHQWTEHAALRGAWAQCGGLTHPEWLRSSNQELPDPVKKGYVQVQQSLLDGYFKCWTKVTEENSYIRVPFPPPQPVGSVLVGLRWKHILSDALVAVHYFGFITYVDEFLNLIG